MSYNLRLLISCPDRKGLIAAISSFIAMHDGNILSADQYVSEGGAEATFFMRLEIEGAASAWSAASSGGRLPLWPANTP